MNLLFLVNIVRILVTKLKDDQQSEGILHVRKALRATMILFPLLGMTNLLFFINPKNGTHDKIYVIFNATMQSSQAQCLKINPKSLTFNPCFNIAIEAILETRKIVRFLLSQLSEFW